MSARTMPAVPLLLILGAAAAAAQDSATEAAAHREEPIVQRGPLVGRRMVVPVRIDVDLRDLPAPVAWEPGDAIKEIPRRGHPRPGQEAPSIETGPDPLLALQPEFPEPYRMPFNVPLVNVDAQDFTGVDPPDTNADVGPNHVIHAINTSSGSSIVVFDKNMPVPNVLATFVLDTLPGVPAPCNVGLGDPVVLYDPLANRWLLSEFSQSGNRMCVYISQSADPVTGGWFVYQFQAPTFPDYPKFGVWPDAYYVSTNEADIGAAAAYAFDRVNMLAGQAARPQVRFAAPADLVFGFEALQPADIDGPTGPPAGSPGIFIRHRDDEASPPPPPGVPDPVNDFLQIWEFRVNFDNPGSSTFTGPINLPITDFSSELCGFQTFSCFPQPNGGAGLDPLREVVMFRLAYRNFGSHQTLVGNLVTDADGEGGGDPLERGGIRWFELRKTTGAWTLFQEGTYSPDVVPRWMAGIAMDASGNIAVGYNVTNPTNPQVFPGLRYAGRLASDPPGTLGAEVNLVSGAGSNASIRYGDYSSMSVDPADDCTFWFTGMYNPGSTWRTRLAAFKFDSCGVALPDNTAIFNNGLQAPSCLASGRSCESGTLLRGRDTITGGPEPNQPNTIADSCADGTAGIFHVRESIDRIRVTAIDGPQLLPGRRVRVEVDVWGFSRGFLNTLDLYRASNANAPSWVYVGSVKSTQVGAHTLALEYVLPTGVVQAVRARYRYAGDRSPCGAGAYDDHDDLAFLTQ